MGYTITEKGTVTIPVDIRKKYRLSKGTKVTFVETSEGVMIMPVLPLKELYGSDREAKETVYRMIREIETERRREASEG